MGDVSIYRIGIEKQRFKFAAAHMTIFPNKTKENLHGHNYQVSLSIRLAKHNFKDLISFKDFKDCLAPICQQLDEKILIAQKNPYSSLQEQEGSLVLEILSKKYMFPLDEVELLPLENITTEYLAEYVGGLYVKNLKNTFLKSPEKLQQILSVELSVKESFGQDASVLFELNK